MLDHVLLDVISAIRSSFESALLDRQAIEERFQIDVFLGDVSWETSYSLPGEGSPPRVRADLSIDWPTWSQSAYRSWSIGETPDDPPELVVEIALRIQRLAEIIDPSTVLAALGDELPAIGSDQLERSCPTVELAYDKEGHPSKDPSRCAVEITYEGSCSLDEAVLEDPDVLEDRFAQLGRWVASILVRLGDLELPFLPPGDETLGVP